MIDKIFGYLIVIGILFFWFTGRTDILVDEILTSSEQAFGMTIKILPLLALWLGIMNIASASGLLDKLTKFTKPLLRKIFPEIPQGDKSFNYISANILANMFGLSNAATPLGIKAMQSMQEINSNKKVASNSMITFLVMNTAGFTIIPTTIIALRKSLNSTNPTVIIPMCIIVSLLSMVIALIINYLFRKWSK